MQLKALGTALALAVTLTVSGCAHQADNSQAWWEDGAPLHLASQGLFSAGGIVIKSEGVFNPEDQWEESGKGQTAHVDHANVLFQIPLEVTGAPLVFLHGYGQSRMGYMVTPDGRDGWATEFLRAGHPVFLIDGPRRGEAGSTSVGAQISTKTLDQRWYTQFRIGRYVKGQSVVNKGSQFPNDKESLNQFFRQMTPDTGMSSDMGADFDLTTVAKGLAATVDEVYKRTGEDSILITHSQGGGPGWAATLYTSHLAGIIAIEPGRGPLKGEERESLEAQRIPVTIYFGDYIDNGDPKLKATASWQEKVADCADFVADYTAKGLDATLLELPKIGIYGNDHFIFQDKNSAAVARHVKAWLDAHPVK